MNDIIEKYVEYRSESLKKSFDFSDVLYKTAVKMAKEDAEKFLDWLTTNYKVTIDK